jgi:hypothetical protein
MRHPAKVGVPLLFVNAFFKAAAFIGRMKANPIPNFDTLRIRPSTTPAVTAAFDDVAVGQAIEQRCGHLGVAE